MLLSCVCSLSLSLSLCIDTLKDVLSCDYPHCIFSSIVLPTPLVSDTTPSAITTVTVPRACNCTQGACSNETGSETTVERESSVIDNIEITALPVSETAPAINDNDNSAHQR